MRPLKYTVCSYRYHNIDDEYDEYTATKKYATFASLDEAIEYADKKRKVLIVESSAIGSYGKINSYNNILYKKGD